MQINKILVTALQCHKYIYDKRELRKQLINTFERFNDHVPKKKLLHWAGITHQQFYAWRRRRCKASLLDICRLRHPNQLTFKEVKTITTYLNDNLTDLLTKVSVYSKMIREGAAFMSLKTFYNYATLLGHTNHKLMKKKRREGIRAIKPKQILHMDVTVYKFQNNTKAFIYLIQDNYSRCILNWKVSRYCNSQTAVENLKEACIKHKLFDEDQIDLIVDGGAENKGMVTEFLKHKIPFYLKLRESISTKPTI